MLTPGCGHIGRRGSAQFRTQGGSVPHQGASRRGASRRGRGDAGMGALTADLIGRARSGDGEAFGELISPYRRELQVHCYRILGSAQDAEDALQETLLAAWQGLDGFQGRASVRTWLYRVATSRCLNALRSARRRPAVAWPLPGVEPPAPSRLGEVPWLEPYPDLLLEGLAHTVPAPAAR